MRSIRDMRAARVRARHNGGPPLDDYAGPRWGKGDPSLFLHWERAHRAAWRNVSRDVMLLRLAKAEACGLSYEEYNLEILERGRYLQPDDAVEIAAVKARRKPRALIRYSERGNCAGRGNRPSSAGPVFSRAMTPGRSSTEQTTAFSWLGRLIGSTPQPKAQASAGERRTAPRRETSIEARLVPEFGRSFACRIVDVSLGGARVRFDGQAPANLDTVCLVFLPSQRTHVARVRWRHDAEIGLEFVG